MSGIQVYRRDVEDTVAACVLDDLTLFYHRRSGQTHMVISPVPEIWDHMADGAPVTAQAMHDRLSRDYDLGPVDDAIAEIGAHLDALVALGLVQAQ
ncbi:HPr-rel-A system PqqD family peptide chaperone [Sphingobium sp. CR2-8]|uniref:HPr-rel-A system PqqD family peptide chaperone n=1 Tax=Sphingobium sp. CR2-8 TaxID=1306534 RepID=UPI002DBF6785|nr:HPr-rel-A system PqqD family peptide chaperone [Sphingobium sp. CR2-8]MEC3910647.1 HPr-rel-A system PqqD family peptide chaperone [Sphingobium sp. CR2-8]